MGNRKLTNLLDLEVFESFIEKSPMGTPREDFTSGVKLTTKNSMTDLTILLMATLQ